ncbi:MAG: hypothetical protein U1F43_21615 [Myxococcota bacterium]
MSIALPLVLTGVLVLALRAFTRRAALDYAARVVPDAGGRYLHIFGHKTYMPDDSDSFSVHHHLLLDLDTLQLYSAEKQRGEDLELASPFVKRSLEHASSALGTALALERGKRGVGEGELVIGERSGRSTDTEVPKPLPPDGLVVWHLSDTPSRTDLELRRDGRTHARWPLRGSVNEPRSHIRWYPERGLLVVVYARDLGLRSGAGLALFDARKPALIRDGFLRMGAPKRPRPG